MGATSGARTAILPEHLSSPPVLSGVTRSSVLCVCFVYRCLSFCPFSFGHCVVCPSIYGFWLPPWYLQTLFVVFDGCIFQQTVGIPMGTNCVPFLADFSINFTFCSINDALSRNNSKFVDYGDVFILMKLFQRIPQIQLDVLPALKLTVNLWGLMGL